MQSNNIRDSFISNVVVTPSEMELETGEKYSPSVSGNVETLREERDVEVHADFESSKDCYAAVTGQREGSMSRNARAFSIAALLSRQISSATSSSSPRLSDDNSSDVEVSRYFMINTHVQCELLFIIILSLI